MEDKIQVDAIFYENYSFKERPHYSMAIHNEFQPDLVYANLISAASHYNRK